MIGDENNVGRLPHFPSKLARKLVVTRAVLTRDEKEGRRGEARACWYCQGGLASEDFVRFRTLHSFEEENLSAYSGLKDTPDRMASSLPCL
jgi:hypothetical protein